MGEQLWYCAWGKILVLYVGQNFSSVRGTEFGFVCGTEFAFSLCVRQNFGLVRGAGFWFCGRGGVEFWL